MNDARIGTVAALALILAAGLSPATVNRGLPWQYYHAAFAAGPKWTTVELPFDAFKPAALKAKLDPSHLIRLAVVASEKEFRADIAVSRVEFIK
jgi:hypothetical protein